MRLLGQASVLAASLFVAGCVSSPSRTVRLDVPPVIQRAPGWCAPASLSRALATCGIDAGQADLARRGNCTPDGGVDVTAFCRSLRVFLALRGLKLVPLMETDAKLALRIARRHDVEAERIGAAPLSRTGASSGAELSLDALFAGADPESMRRATLKRLPQFRKAVSRALSREHPALWGVVLGIVPESGSAGAATRGGHVRLIIGFDSATDKIFYSDPWGPDCAEKEMDAADACAITMSLWSLEDGAVPAVFGPDRKGK